METILNKESRAVIELMVADGIIAKDTAERYFPELIESEGERIKKRIIEWIEEIRKCNPNNAEHNGDCSEAIAWLEKQGEQKPVIEMKTPEESLGISSEEYNKIVDECIYGEQKPWSEEDEDVINHLLAICAGAKRYRQFAGCSQDDVTKYQTWLKSLKPKNTWKPSDEQMKALDDVISSREIKYDILSNLWQDLKKLREE